MSTKCAWAQEANKRTPLGKPWTVARHVENNTLKNPVSKIK